MVSFWREMASASWLAGTGVPLLVTVVAIVIGFWLVRRQLGNDHRLMVAQGRAQAARALAATIRRCTEPATFAALDDLAYWRRGRLPGGADLKAAIDEADVLLGEVEMGRTAHTSNRWGFA
jgi:hypothetical protein